MARQSIFGTPASAVIVVRVTAEQRSDLERAARVNRTDITGVIREAVNVYVSECLESPRRFCITEPETAA